jgi:hypothetical protein
MLTTLTDIEGRHAAATAAHSEAVQRTRALWGAAEKERQRASAAAQLGSQMLEKAAVGEADVTDDDLLAAADAAKRAAAVASISEAKAAAALQAQHRTQIAEVTARRDVVQADFDGTVTRLLSIDAHIDELKAQLEDAIAARNTQVQAVVMAYQAGHHFNMLELNPGHHQNPLLSQMNPSQQPRVRLPQHGASSYTLRLELYANLGAGRRDIIHSVAPRTRLEYERQVERDEG